MSALVDKFAGATPSLAMAFVVLMAKVCLAQPLHRPLEPRQGVAPHPSAAAIGGPARVIGATPREPRFPIAPAGAFAAKAPLAPREVRHAVATPVDAPNPPAHLQDPHKRQVPLLRQNHAAPSHANK